MHLWRGCDSRPRFGAAHEILWVQISPRKGKESQTSRLREIERDTFELFTQLLSVVRARQAASRQQRDKDERERRFQEQPCRIRIQFKTRSARSR